MNIADGPAEQARIRPDKIAIEDGDRKISYGELDRRVRAAASRLSAEGVGLGDFIGIMLPDGADYLILILALARVGAVVVSVNEGLSKSDRKSAVAGLDVSRVVTSGTEPPFDGAVALPVDRIVSAHHSDDCDYAGPDLPPGHPATARQSSGTTGRPKTVLWSHDFMVGRLPRLQERQGWCADDRYLQVVHMSFSYSRDQCIFFLHFGGTVVVNRALGAVALAMSIRDGGITYVGLTPAHLRALIQVESHSWPLFPAMRVLHSTSSALTAVERKLVHDRLTPNLHDGYGTNECGLISDAGPTERAAFPGSVGTIVPGVEAKIVGQDGKPVPAGEVGLLGARARGMPASYFRNEEATARHFRDGWFFPGDLVAMNEEGYLFFKGRADDVINNQGSKFYPLEVEQALRDHPAIVESAVLGWPHARFGQAAIACCVLTEELKLGDVQDFCLERIASHKIPAAVVRVERLPKTTSGKVRKGEVAKLLKQVLDPVLP